MSFFVQQKETEGKQVKFNWALLPSGSYVEFQINSNVGQANLAC